jgi:predicted Zn-dependent peptidase
MKVNVLKNGISVLFVNKNLQDLVLVGFVCKSGYDNEYGVYPNGTASVIERMFLTGTHKNPSGKKIWNAIEEIGARIETITEAQTTSFYLLVPKENQFKAISLIGEIIQKSLFEESELNKCKQELMDEIIESKRSVSVNFGLENLYTCFSYSQSKYGTIDQIMAIDRGIVYDFLSKAYRPSNCFLVVSGNFQQKQIFEQIEQEWGYWTPTIRTENEEYFNYNVCRKDLPKIPFLQSAKGNTDININFILPEGLRPKEFYNTDIEITTDYLPIIWDNYFERYIVYLIINEILIGGNSGKLWINGVFEEKYLNHVQSQLLMFLESGCFSIYANIENTNFVAGLDLIFKILGDLKNNLLTETEINKAKEMTKISLLIIKSDLEKSTKFIVNNFILAGNSYDISDLVTKINYIEPTQVKEIAMDIFRKDNFCMSMIGTNKENKSLEKVIDKYL